MSLLVSDAIIPAAVRFSDVASLVNKFVKGPMAKSQAGMNDCIKGNKVHPDD
jgi:hypothetical protein